MRRAVSIFGPFFLVLALSAPAHATFPGANGKLAFTSGNAIWAVNPDGTGMTQLSFPPAGYRDGSAAWSPEGDRIVFGRDCCDGDEVNSDLYVMNADGSGLTQLTFTCCGAFDLEPSWSPDGTKIVFEQNYLYTMNADGSGVARLTNFVADSADWSPNGNPIAFHDSTVGGIGLINADGSGRTALTSTPSDFVPSWSPDGTRVAFSRSINAGNVFRTEVFTVNADGSGETNRTNDTLPNDDHPAWSPDGKKIAWAKVYDAIWIMNADGSGQTALGVSGRTVDWQPLPTASYHHPQSASQLNVSLVPAFKPCGTGGNPSNAKHAPPLATNSCNPPKPSVLAAVGTTSQSSALMTVVPGDTDPTNGNQANVSISASLTDIQSTAGGDYNPNPSGADLTAVTRLRVTDKANGYGGLPATATEYDFKVPIDCSSTPDPSVGSTCSANTTANALMPSLIQEQRQTVIQAFRVRIDDSGANGTRGDSDDRIFATQGLFVP